MCNRSYHFTDIAIFSPRDSRYILVIQEFNCNLYICSNISTRNISIMVLILIFVGNLRNHSEATLTLIYKYVNSIAGKLSF